MRFAFASLAILLLVPPALPPRTGGGTGAKPGASAPAAPVRVEIGQFNDRRGGSFAQLRFGLLLPDIPGSSVLAERVVVTTAVDDTGRDLRGDAGKETGFTLNERGFFGGKEPDAKPVPALVTLDLASPARSATLLKEVSGEIELYVPGRDPDSVADLPKFLAKGGGPLAHPALKANGVVLSLVSRASLEAEKKKLGEKTRLEETKKGTKGEDLEDAVSNALDSFWLPDEGDVVLKVKDPGKRIQQFSYVDAAGEEKLVAASEQKGYTVLSTWAVKADGATGLRVRMRTPKSIVRTPFSLKDVPLP